MIRTSIKHLSSNLFNFLMIKKLNIHNLRYIDEINSQ